MRRILSFALAIMMVFSMTIMASAENTTVLTTTVPDAEYTLNIPADQTISYGATKAEIGVVTVTNATGFAEGKNLQVTLTYNDFACANVSTTIPYTVGCSYMINGGQKDLLPTGDAITFLGLDSGAVEQYHQFTAKDSGGHDYQEDAEVYFIEVESSDWGKALGGTYTSTITFTAKVVVE